MLDTAVLLAIPFGTQEALLGGSPQPEPCALLPLALTQVPGLMSQPGVPVRAELQPGVCGLAQRRGELRAE